MAGTDITIRPVTRDDAAQWHRLYTGYAEVYRVEQRRPIGTEEFAELAARALVSHHLHALRRS